MALTQVQGGMIGSLPVGSVLQVVQATTSTEVTNSTAGYIDTNLTASITPKFATSKILVLVSQSTYKSPGNASNAISIKLLRGATDLGVVIYLQGYTASTSHLYSIASSQYLDSPSTTSTITYKTMFANLVAFSLVSVQPDSAGPSRITLMEIAA